jgi:hypothetical protein
MELTSRKILIRAKRGFEEALRILPEAAVKLDAVRFFAIFTAVFKRLNTSKDKNNLWQLVKQRVKEVRDFTRSDAKETVRAFLLSVACITEAETGDKELLDKCERFFPKTFNRFMAEYNKIIESWNKNRPVAN